MALRLGLGTWAMDLGGDWYGAVPFRIGAGGGGQPNKFLKQGLKNFLLLLFQFQGLRFRA